MVVDFHVHAFPEKIAKRAMEKLARVAGALVPCCEGTIEGMTAQLASADAMGVLLPIATRPENQLSINNWASGVKSERILPFGSIHPAAPDALDELERIRSLGLKGVKLHPEYQQFFVDDPAFRKVWKKIASLGLITVFHAGFDMAYPPPCGCSPEGLARALPAFEGAPVVAAHLGGYMQWEGVLQSLCGLPLYLDTAYSHGRCIVPLAQRIIERHGVDKILFGSDAPWSSTAEELSFVGALGLSPEEYAKVTSGNAKALLSSVGAMR